jgi:hypothetical protein
MVASATPAAAARARRTDEGGAARSGSTALDGASRAVLPLNVLARRGSQC